MRITQFKKTVWNYYKKHGRHDLLWRKTKDPYKILVSEIMLQQTQVSRVIPKYKSFLKKFPTVEALAKAQLKDVLSEWQGLGYNRRGMYLKKCAERIISDFDGKFPKDFKTLCSIPGIGPATAGDILAFAYNIPVVVIETNIRSVFIHHFFTNKPRVSDVDILPLIDKGAKANTYTRSNLRVKNEKLVHDKEILPLIQRTLDMRSPREWYWALFDYGAYLKSTHTNPSRKSVHHAKQSHFEGSNRQKRARILKFILEKPRTEGEILQLTEYEPFTVKTNLRVLSDEGFIIKKQKVYMVV